MDISIELIYLVVKIRFVGRQFLDLGYGMKQT